MKKVFVVVLVSLVILSSQSFAWGSKGGKYRGRGMKMGFMHKLNLSEQQQKQFMEQKQKMEKDTLSLRQREQRIRLEMKKELQKDSPDKNKLYGYIREINKIRTEMQIKRMDYMLNMRSQLTPEQRMKFKKF